MRVDILRDDYSAAAGYICVLIQDLDPAPTRGCGWLHYPQLLWILLLIYLKSLVVFREDVSDRTHMLVRYWEFTTHA